MDLGLSLILLYSFFKKVFCLNVILLDQYMSVSLIEKRMYEKYEYISIAYELISTVLLCIAHIELDN